MDLGSRFRKFAQQQEEKRRKWQREMEQKYEKSLQLLEKYSPLVERVCREFAEALHWGFDMEKDTRKPVWGERQTGLVCCHYRMSEHRDYFRGRSVYVMMNTSESFWVCRPHSVRISSAYKGESIGDRHIDISLKELTEQKLADALVKICGGR